MYRAAPLPVEHRLEPTLYPGCMSNSRARGSLVAVHVHVRVTPEAVERFGDAARKNAEGSVREPGVLRFDVMQQVDDPTRFVLVEVYRDAQAVLAHKETAHYLEWRDAVAEMMAEPRAATKYVNVFPDDDRW
jgi:quinol monooxygenase YgiN